MPNRRAIPKKQKTGFGPVTLATPNTKNTPTPGGCSVFLETLQVKIVRAMVLRLCGTNASHNSLRTGQPGHIEN